MAPRTWRMGVPLPRFIRVIRSESLNSTRDVVTSLAWQNAPLRPKAAWVGITNLVLILNEPRLGQ